MRTHLAPADLGDLLDRPILAVLATRRRDESTMLSPVWFEWDGDAVVIWVGGADDGKARHLAADPRTTVVIAESDLPYRGMEVTGQAELTHDGYDAAIRRISARYVGPEAAEEIARGFPNGLLIRVLPGKIRAWDFVDDYGAAAGRQDA